MAGIGRDCCEILSAYEGFVDEISIAFGCRRTCLPYPRVWFFLCDTMIGG